MTQCDKVSIWAILFLPLKMVEKLVFRSILYSLFYSKLIKNEQLTTRLRKVYNQVGMYYLRDGIYIETGGTSLELLDRLKAVDEDDTIN